LSQLQGHGAVERIMSMKNSNDTIGNRSRDLQVCSAVPQPLLHRVPPTTTKRWDKIPIFLSLSCRSAFLNRHTSKSGERNTTSAPRIMNAALYPPDKNKVKSYAHLPYYYVMWMTTDRRWKEESYAGNKSNFSTFASRKRHRDGIDVIPKLSRFYPRGIYLYSISVIISWLDKRACTQLKDFSGSAELMIDASVYDKILMQKLGLLSTSIGQWGPNYSLKRPYSFEEWLQK
jgi:hypothetical protein